MLDPFNFQQVILLLEMVKQFDAGFSFQGVYHLKSFNDQNMIFHSCFTNYCFFSFKVNALQSSVQNPTAGTYT